MFGILARSVFKKRRFNSDGIKNSHKQACRLYRFGRSRHIVVLDFPVAMWVRRMTGDSASTAVRDPQY